MLRDGYTSVKESHNVFEEVLLNNPSLKMDEQVDKEPSGCFCSFTRIIRLFKFRKIFSTKQS